MGAEFWDDLGRKVSGAVDVIGKKTEGAVEYAKIKNQIYTLEREIGKDFETIGKMVYEQFLENKETQEMFRELCETIARKEILVDQYKGELEERKGKY